MNRRLSTYIGAAGFVALALCQGPVSAEVSLVVSVSGLGRVISDPPGISCPDTCEASFSARSNVRLQANPDKGQKLLTWGGDCHSPTHSCRLYMDREKIVQVGFSAGL